MLEEEACFGGSAWRLGRLSHSSIDWPGHSILSPTKTSAHPPTHPPLICGFPTHPKGFQPIHYQFSLFRLVPQDYLGLARTLLLFLFIPVSRLARVLKQEARILEIILETKASFVSSSYTSRATHIVSDELLHPPTHPSIDPSIDSSIDLPSHPPPTLTSTALSSAHLVP